MKNKYHQGGIIYPPPPATSNPNVFISKSDKYNDKINANQLNIGITIKITGVAKMLFRLKLYRLILELFQWILPYESEIKIILRDKRVRIEKIEIPPFNDDELNGAMNKLKKSGKLYRVNW